MKKNYSFVAACLVVMCSAFWTSCSNENKIDSVFTPQDVKLAKNPDFRLSSGYAVLAESSGTRGNVVVNGNYFKIQDFGGGKSDWMKSNYPVLYNYYDNAPSTTDRGEQVSTAEYQAVMNYLKNHPDEGGTTCNLTTYFIQNVGSSYDSYHLAFMNGASVHHYTDITGGNQMDYFELNNLHVNDYNAHYGPRALCVNIPLVNPRYHESYASLTEENHYRFYVIEYAGKKNLYLCFDYATKKYDNGQLDFGGDGVFSDWVIKIIPADGSEIDPDNPDPDPDPDVDPYDFYAYDHVEVNLSVNDKHDEGDWIHTKLSIHIRAVTDVEVFIPVKSEYYCNVDDMNIVISNALDLVKYIPQPTTESFTITNQDNGDTYQVSASLSFEPNGIRITTYGMTAELQDYLNKTYGDGLTFEIWNYYNIDAIDRENLKPYLDASTVSFTSDPTLFVNAFAPIGEDNHKNPWDCVVTPPAPYSIWYERTYDKYYDFDVLYKKP